MASAALAGSPAKTPPRLPAAIAKASPEELQKMVVDALVKMRKKDKRIEELTAAAAAAGAAATAAPAEAELGVTEALQQQVRSQHPRYPTSVA